MKPETVEDRVELPCAWLRDAAMSLVPDGLSWAAGDCNEDDIPWACLTDRDGNDYAATGATTIIALVHASLRARMSEAT